jgi:hypothetical protein
MENKRKHLIVRLALAGALATPVLAVHAQDAAARKVAPAFGNTVMSIYPDGRSQKIWMHPDGTWDGKSRRGNPLAGSWTVKGEKVCVRQSKPPTLPISFCIPFPAEPEVGVSWTSKDLTGTPIKLTIVKGMPEAKAGT